MENKTKIGFLVILLTAGLISFAEDWGFYAHRKINYYAVLTVPPPLNLFFKHHIGYIRSEAVGPDQRRYTVPQEGPRHFIDLDRWMSGDSLLLTKDFTLDRIIQGGWTWVTADRSVPIEARRSEDGRIIFRGEDVDIRVDSIALRREVFAVPANSVFEVSPSFYPNYKGSLIFADSLTIHGIVPYQIERMYRRLIRHMMEKDLASVLRTCADLGHYISDAHVPLHTTSNYNGQFTGQLGIHAFWESRIPELFEESEFNSLVGRAQYIGDIHAFIWRVVERSYSLIPSVLEKELEARQSVESQHHFCYEERGNTMVRTQCPEFAREYMIRMGGMVQDQWRRSIKAVGSVWYSAWIDAGQPDLWTENLIGIPDTGMIDRIRQLIDRSRHKSRKDLH